jgi:hypothetical protein
MSVKERIPVWRKGASEQEVKYLKLPLLYLNSIVFVWVGLSRNDSY